MLPLPELEEEEHVEGVEEPCHEVESRVPPSPVARLKTLSSTDDGQYFLMVYRPLELGGSAPMILFVDRVVVTDNRVQAFDDKGLMLMEFPETLPYLLFRRELITLLDHRELRCLPTCEACRQARKTHRDSRAEAGITHRGTGTYL
jgi:hypothetical protein